MTGALPANRLLGLYTARAPAASGGVWDRVRAVQRFEAALRTRSSDAIAKTLPDAWGQMRRANLELIFADLFAEALDRYALSGAAGVIASDMLLLSRAYAQAADNDSVPPLLRSLAGAEIEPPAPTTSREEAILLGFDSTRARADLTAMARNNRMGEALLRTLMLLDDGAAGDPLALTEALATLRAFGLEDTARRAALQILLLERFNS